MNKISKKATDTLNQLNESLSEAKLFTKLADNLAIFCGLTAFVAIGAHNSPVSELLTPITHAGGVMATASGLAGLYCYAKAGFATSRAVVRAESGRMVPREVMRGEHKAN